MTNRSLDIDAIVIASPCSVPWASMRGDAVKRFCDQCRLHVYDLSQMRRTEIEELFASTGGAFCKRIWRRPDGRLITKDCRRVVPALQRKLRAAATAAAGALALVGLFGCGSKSSSGTKDAVEPPTTPAASGAEEDPASNAPEPGATEFIGR